MQAGGHLAARVPLRSSPGAGPDVPAHSARVAAAMSEGEQPRARFAAQYADPQRGAKLAGEFFDDVDPDFGIRYTRILHRGQERPADHPHGFGCEGLQLWKFSRQYFPEHEEFREFVTSPEFNAWFSLM